MSKSAIIDKAQKLASGGNIKEAIKEWQKLLSESQDNGNIYNAIGDLQLKANMKDDAVTAYLEAAGAFKEAGFDLKSIALYKKTIKVDPSRHDIYENLADIHAERGLVGNAIDDYLRAAKYYVKQDNVRASLDVYRKMANLDPENSGIRIRIAEMCQKEGFGKEAIEEFGKVLTLYEGKGMTSEAEEMREKILSLDPDYFENQDVPELENQGAPELDVPLLETSETLHEEMLSDEVEKSPGLIGPDLPQESSGSEAVSGPAMSGEGSQSAEVGLPETDVSSSGETSALDEVGSEGEVIPGGEETSFVDPLPGADAEAVSPKEISETAFKGYLTEAEVYFKYGLNSKAIDQLLLVSKLCPDRKEPHLKLKEIYIQEGITEKAVEACCTLARLFHAKGDEENVKETLNELSLLDHDGNYRQELDEEILAFENIEMAPEIEIGEDRAPATEVESEASGSEMVFDLEGDLDIESSLMEAEEEVSKEEDLDSLRGDLVGEEAGSEDKEASAWDPEAIPQENDGGALEQLEAESPLSEVEASSLGTGTSSEDDLVPDEVPSLSEESEASPVGGVDEASFEGVSEGAFPDLTSMEDSVSELIEEPIAEIEEKEEKEEKEEYVNLASILSEEIGDQIEESSGLDDTLLEGAFNELKREVGSTQNEKDLETHYDLGIAYKEMDMIPEAIKEFELASQGDNRFQDAVIMLASCYRSRDAMITAIKTLQDALEDPRCTVDKRVTLLYELAILLDLSGDKKKAGLLYEEVYQAEPGFRDVEKRRRLNEVERAELSASESKPNTESKKKNKISYI